ncbi:RNA polymerase sigma factor [Pelagicoccus mobilis]|uniref:Sigma-70 family RNA polymerase sigma factor n=1 Tax=Pelagicoccus mobilis TaxID=415221 RepID=A0A934VP97_9BACT|nr:sigma-70 family RNA polymerase sigma factor [Pelagicoccus mobilis]MBK1877057.1 sigma-70 family RNA polymerase sigma factor [Pelagicoccus mobilis]
MSTPDPQALRFYEELLSQMQPKLYAYILSLVSSPADAKDTLQETNRVILQKLEELQRPERFAPWSYRIAYFQSLSLIKKRAKRWGTLSEQTLDEIASLSEEAGSQNEARLRRLEACLLKLREKTRVIVSEYYYQASSIKDIAAKHDLSANHVGQVLFRARKALFECMTQSESSEDE